MAYCFVQCMSDSGILFAFHFAHCDIVSCFANAKVRAGVFSIRYNYIISLIQEWKYEFLFNMRQFFMLFRCGIFFFFFSYIHSKSFTLTVKFGNNCTVRRKCHISLSTLFFSKFTQIPLIQYNFRPELYMALVNTNLLTYLYRRNQVSRSESFSYVSVFPLVIITFTIFFSFFTPARIW